MRQPLAHASPTKYRTREMAVAPDCDAGAGDAQA